MQVFLLLLRYISMSIIDVNNVLGGLNSFGVDQGSAASHLDEMLDNAFSDGLEMFLNSSEDLAPSQMDPSIISNDYLPEG
jgi:hypothetical protein